MNNIRSSFGLVLLGSLLGCVGTTPEGPRAQNAGPWEDCLEAIEEGVAGDGCDFDPEVIGTAMICATLQPVEVANYEVDVVAHCRSGSLILSRREAREGPDDIAPSVQEDGCLLRAPGTRGPQEVLCVADDLLPDPGAGGAAVDIDGQGACEAIVDGSVQAGDPCIGDTICATVAAEHVYDHPDSASTWGRPGVYAWCGAGRIRLASTLLELPCDDFDAARQMYLCAL